jgi:Flp pilus assembly protein TadB
MTPFDSNQWMVVLLVFLLGLLIGMFITAGSKWKRRYREEVRRREEIEAEHNRRHEELRLENERLHREGREMDTLRHAAARTPGGDPDAPRGPL